MPTEKLHTLEAAKQGDPIVIAALINRQLQPKGITAKVARKEECLQVILESPKAPNQQACVEFIRRGLTKMQVKGLNKVQIWGRETGDEFPSWQAEFKLVVQPATTPTETPTQEAVEVQTNTEEIDSTGVPNPTPLEPQPSLMELAKQGDIQAIAGVMNYLLENRGITVTAKLNHECLFITLLAKQIPNQEESVRCIRKTLDQLQITSVKQVKVYGRRQEGTFSAWSEEFDLEPAKPPGPPLPSDSLPSTPSPNTPFWMSIMGGITGTAEAVSGTVSGATSAVGGTAFGALTGAAGVIGGTVSGAAGAVGSAAGAIGNTVSGATGAVGGAAVMAGEAISGTVVNVAGAVGSATLQTTDGIGYLLDMIKHSPQLQELTRALKVDGFLHLIEAVDIVKAEAHVKKLQQKYPSERPNEIAHRIMLEKAIYVGGLGLTSSLMPGVATAMFAVDLAATTAVQAEMVYQIACAYGMDLHEPARKAEVLAIFGLAFGGGYALKVGLGFARSIPGAGPAIGAGSNAAMLYALGYGACRFYEAKLNPGSTESNAQTSQTTSEEYLKTAIAQQLIMDQILVHVVLASHPDKSREQILPILQDLGFSTESLHLITVNIQSLPALDELLNQLDRDFAVSLAAQCQKIVQADGVITPEEHKVIAAVTSKLNAVI